MAGTNAYLSIVTLNTSSPNAPIKRYTLIDWVRKQDPSSCCIKKKKKPTTHLTTKDRHHLGAKRTEKAVPSEWNQEASGCRYFYI